MTYGIYHVFTTSFPIHSLLSYGLSLWAPRLHDRGAGSNGPSGTCQQGMRHERVGGPKRTGPHHGALLGVINIHDMVFLFFKMNTFLDSYMQQTEKKSDSDILCFMFLTSSLISYFGWPNFWTAQAAFECRSSPWRRLGFLLGQNSPYFIYTYIYIYCILWNQFFLAVHRDILILYKKIYRYTHFKSTRFCVTIFQERRPGLSSLWPWSILAAFDFFWDPANLEPREENMESCSGVEIYVTSWYHLIPLNFNRLLILIACLWF